MPGPPPPPPPAPSIQASSSAPTPPNNKDLLKSIQKGMKLKKAETNDRSQPVLVEASNKTSGNNMKGGNSQPGGLFAGGMPKLKSASSSGTSSSFGPKPVIPGANASSTKVGQMSSNSNVASKGNLNSSSTPLNSFGVYRPGGSSDSQPNINKSVPSRPVPPPVSERNATSMASLNKPTALYDRNASSSVSLNRPAPPIADKNSNSTASVNRMVPPPVVGREPSTNSLTQNNRHDPTVNREPSSNSFSANRPVPPPVSSRETPSSRPVPPPAPGREPSSANNNARSIPSVKSNTSLTKFQIESKNEALNETTKTPPPPPPSRTRSNSALNQADNPNNGKPPPPPPPSRNNDIPVASNSNNPLWPKKKSNENLAPPPARGAEISRKFSTEIISQPSVIICERWQFRPFQDLPPPKRFQAFTKVYTSGNTTGSRYPDISEQGSIGRSSSNTSLPGDSHQGKSPSLGRRPPPPPPSRNANPVGGPPPPRPPR